MKNMYSISFRLSTLLCLLFCFISCQNNTETANTTDNQQVKAEDDKQPLDVSFQLSTIEDDINGPKSSISAILNGKKIQFAEAINCEVVEKDVYDSKNVPLDATWACACWWAGDGISFYAQKMDTKVEIYKQEVYEGMKTEDEKWELLKTLE